MSNAILYIKNEELREALCADIQQYVNTVLDFDNWDEFEKNLFKSKCDVILIDFSTGSLELIDQLKSLPDELLAIPLIGLIDFNKTADDYPILEIFESYEVLYKPFKPYELRELISRSLTTTKSDEAYAPISIDSFYSMKELGFNLYLQIQQGKYLLVGRKNTKVFHEQLDHYKHKGVNTLFVENASLPDVTSFQIEKLDSVALDKDVPLGTKLQLMTEAGRILFQRIETHGINNALWGDAEDYVSGLLQVLTENFECEALLKQFQDKDGDIFERSLFASMHVILLCRTLEKKNLQDIQDLSMAALFNDIGLTKIPSKLRNSLLLELSPEDQAIYKDHPELSVTMLSKSIRIPGDVLRLIKEHHEDTIGTGYPGSLDIKSQHPNSYILQIIAMFSDFVFAQKKASPKKTAINALGKMEELYSNAIDGHAFGALKALYL